MIEFVVAAMVGLLSQLDVVGARRVAGCLKATLLRLGRGRGGEGHRSSLVRARIWFLSTSVSLLSGKGVGGRENVGL
jgi:hypothetical protein